MSKFCKKCGSGIEVGMSFCEACGSPILASAKNELTAQSDELLKVSSLSGRKMMLIVGGGCAGLLVLAVGIWFLTGAPSKPSDTALSALLNADDGYKSRTVCLANFKYDHNAANIDVSDQDSRDWFGVLVGAGLYNDPQIVTTGGWIPRELLQYTPTDKGKLAIKNGKLCFAQGVVVDKVTYGPIQQARNTSYAIADYSYHFLDADEWTKRPEAKNLAAVVLGQEPMTGRLVVERTNKEWTVSEIAAESLPLLVAARQAQSVRHDSNSSGFLAGFTSLFSGMAGNPLLGKWSNSITGEVVEFRTHEVVGDRGEVKIKYEIKGNQVNLTNLDTQRVTLCTVIDSEHMKMVEGGRVYQFNRTKNE